VEVDFRPGERNSLRGGKDVKKRGKEKGGKNQTALYVMEGVRGSLTALRDGRVREIGGKHERVG